jgi:hypothetical protein
VLLGPGHPYAQKVATELPWWDITLLIHLEVMTEGKKAT